MVIFIITDSLSLKLSNGLVLKKDIPVFQFIPSEANFWDAKLFEKNQDLAKLYPSDWIYHVSGKRVKFMPIPDYGFTFSIKDK